jgi:ADP-ribose pyrophosphatase YjhB (NUDIX family)
MTRRVPSMRFGETYDKAARRELAEETGIASQLTYLWKFMHFDPPENEIVAVFAAESDEVVKIDRMNLRLWSSGQKEEVDSIVDCKLTAPWLRNSWKLFRDSV